MRKILLAIVLLVVLVSPAAAGGIVGYAGVSSEIIDCGVDTPDNVTEGDTFSVTAWVTARQLAASHVEYSGCVPGLAAGIAETEIETWMSRDGMVGAQGDGTSQRDFDWGAGRKFTVDARVDGTTTFYTTLTGTARRGGESGSAYFSTLASAHLVVLSPGGLWITLTTWDSAMMRWQMDVKLRRTSQPVAEHVVVFGLPTDTRWCRMERLDDVGWVEVPPMQPSNQIDAVHIDLMVHGTDGCWYRMTPNTGHALEFWVPNTGSTRTTVVEYAR